MGHMLFRAMQNIVMRVFNKYIATMFSFIYTFIWYGAKKNLTWSALSYAEYKIEVLANIVRNLDFYKDNVVANMSPIMHRRWCAFLSVPLAILSLFANMFLLNTLTIPQLFDNIFNGKLNCIFKLQNKYFSFQDLYFY